ncbi:hypothetical protein Dsin_006055 [Dipteronia sinensis]|uniref:Uncharacterized protein n=1 Tax=Dipteronia sinensis TaxID=43782 RepID=A0AAE0EF70_9ROSI|nr:hypothetical protein Dsin_006055 [Dipteronia sinensis]
MLPLECLMFTLLDFESSTRFVGRYRVSRQLKYWILVLAMVQLSVEYCPPLVRVGGLFVAAKGHDPQVIESGGKNIDVALMTKDDGLKQLKEAKIDAIVTEIEMEKATTAEAAKKGPPKET